MRLRSVFKMRMSILNTATTEHLECIIFSFFVYPKPTAGIKSQTFGQSPLSHRQKYGFHLEPKDRKPEILYRLKCDVGASKNAGQAFSTPRLSSHFSLYNISGFRFLSPSIRIFENTFSFRPQLHHLRQEGQSGLESP